MKMVQRGSEVKKLTFQYVKNLDNSWQLFSERKIGSFFFDASICFINSDFFSEAERVKQYYQNKVQLFFYGFFCPA